MQDENHQTTAKDDRTATTRRTLLKGVGVAGGAALTGGGASYLDAAPVDEADAIAPVVVAGAAVAVAGGGAALGWMLREETADAADAPPQGLTADALIEQTYQTARTRQSTNNSTFVDNKNIIESGAEHAAYAEGKLAAVKALNDGKSESEVSNAATTALDEYHSTVKKNFLRSWNETAREWVQASQLLIDHPDYNWNGWAASTDDGNGVFVDSNDNYVPVPDVTLRTETSAYTLPDGSTMDLVQVYFRGEADSSVYRESYITPLERVQVASSGSRMDDFFSNSVELNEPALAVPTPAGSDTHYYKYSSKAEWKAVYDKIDTAFLNARDGLLTWVTNIYGEVQSGELDTADLLTPRELAQLTASEEDSFNQAVSDLQALNIPTELKRKATVSIPSIGATLEGQLHVTGQTTLQAGDTIDPASASEDYYFTYDVSTSSGTWDAYDADKGVDGGEIALTEKPLDGHEYVISTGAGETATVLASDFAKVDGQQRWTASIGGQLETQITTIDTVEYRAAVEETQFETVQLRNQFTIDGFVDEETGEEKDSATVESPSEPQTDSNYITEEEWQKMKERQQELINKYEEEQNSGGGITGLPALDGIPAWAPGGVIVAVIVYALTQDDGSGGSPL